MAIEFMRVLKVFVRVLVEAARQLVEAERVLVETAKVLQSPMTAQHRQQQVRCVQAAQSAVQIRSGATQATVEQICPEAAQAAVKIRSGAAQAAVKQICPDAAQTAAQDGVGQTCSKAACKTRLQVAQTAVGQTRPGT